MKFQILTIFPDIFYSYLAKGMIRIALTKKIIQVKTLNLRDYAVNRRGTVDDKPFGGGPGQIMLVEPIVKALKKLKAGPLFNTRKNNRRKVILLSAKGKTWNQQLAQKFSTCEELLFICPRYEGHDERIRKFVDEEISIGDYVLTGGELGALTMIDSLTRLLPGVLGEPASLTEESHTTPGILEYPQFTRPEKFVFQVNRQKKSLSVPKILLSGHHEKISQWRLSKTGRKTPKKHL